MKTAAAVVIVAALAWVCRERAMAWRSPVELWRDAAVKAPDKARPAEGFAQALLLAGRLDEAESWADSRVGRFGRRADAEFLHVSGQAALAGGRWHDAAVRFERAAVMRPSHVSWMNAGSAWYHGWAKGQTDPAKALECYRRSIEIEMNDGALDGAADMLAASGVTRIDVDWNDAGAMYLAGKLALLGGDWAHASEWLGRAAALRPDWRLASFNHGSALAGAGKTGECIEALRRALTTDPAFREARFNLGLALHRAGDASAGIHELKASGLLEPFNPKHAPYWRALNHAS